VQRKGVLLDRQFLFLGGKGIVYFLIYLKRAVLKRDGMDERQYVCVNLMK